MRDTKTTGDIGEACILADLSKQGYKVLVPMGDCLPFDLVAYENDNFIKIQVKAVRSNGKTAEVRLRTISNGKVSKVYSAEDTDYIALYDITTDTCAYIGSDIFTRYKNAMTLGYKEGHKNYIGNFGSVGREVMQRVANP